MKKSDIQKRSLAAHKKLKGKIETVAKAKLKNMDDLSLYYTPGVGAVSTYVAEDSSRALSHTMKGNTVAVISDGSAVLGLGNIGPLGALPVMEGKAMIFKEFAGIDAFPIVLATQDVDEIVRTVKNISPVFGGINLEDISAPRCFEIEERLKRELSIPVMHDDQHGTAIVVLAGLTNALRVVKKTMENITVAIVGAGAAGTAVAKLLIKVGVGDIVMVDREGIIHKNRAALLPYKAELTNITNKKNKTGGIAEAIAGADVVVGVSGPNMITEAHIRSMNEKPIVFALANPVPEIDPLLAKKAGAYIVATGRSDFPNQVNNALVYPGIFRGALDKKVPKITDEMKLAAADNLAKLISKPSPDTIIPKIFDTRVVKAVAHAVR